MERLGRWKTSSVPPGIHSEKIASVLGSFGGLHSAIIASHFE